MGGKSWTAWIWYYASYDSRTERQRIEWYPIVTVHPEVSDRREQARYLALKIYPFLAEQSDRLWVGPEGHKPTRKFVEER